MDFRASRSLRERIAAGAELVTFLGRQAAGRSAGGNRGWQARAGREAQIAIALKRALRCDKLTLAALSATLRLYLRSSESGDAYFPRCDSSRRSVARDEADGAARPRHPGRASSARSFDARSSIRPRRLARARCRPKNCRPVAIRVTHPTISANSIASIFSAARATDHRPHHRRRLSTRFAHHRRSGGVRRCFRA